MTTLFSSSSQKCLEESLNVLARGLENNKENSELWYEYLCLYAKHKDATDFSDLCQTALQYAPSFLIWWKVFDLFFYYIVKFFMLFNESVSSIVLVLHTIYKLLNMKIKS